MKIGQVVVKPTNQPTNYLKMFPNFFKKMVSEKSCTIASEPYFFIIFYCLMHKVLQKLGRSSVESTNMVSLYHGCNSGKYTWDYIICRKMG